MLLGDRDPAIKYTSLLTLNFAMECEQGLLILQNLIDEKVLNNILKDLKISNEELQGEILILVNEILLKFPANQLLSLIDYNPFVRKHGIT